MILLAHVMGIPLEESVVPWMSGGVGATALMVLAILRGKVLGHW